MTSATNPDSLLEHLAQMGGRLQPRRRRLRRRGETFDQDGRGTVAEPRAARLRPLRGRAATARPSPCSAPRARRVVLMTTPYYDSGTAPAGGPWPEDDPARVSTDNATMRAGGERRRPAGAQRGQASTCSTSTPWSRPASRYSPTVGQVNVRCTDGVHFTRSGGIFVGLRLAPELAALGQSHAAASPGGAWPGTLPPSTPTWFPNLPCQ